MMDIGNRLELFIDSFLIDELNRTRLRLATPVPAGVALEFDRPWEGVHPYYVSVLQDGDTFKMWYRGVDSEKRGEVGMKDGYDHEWTCTAESRDGIHWSRPSLGLFEILGTRENNVVLAGQPPWSSEFMPFLDTKPGVPGSERYKATVGLGENMNCFRKGWLPKWKAGIHAFVSPDGIHWKKFRQERIYDDFSRVFDGMNQAFWSEPEQCYVLYYRQHTVQDTEKVVEDSITHRRDYAKTVARTTSPDFLHWSGRHMLDWGGRAPTHKECIYTNGIRPYARAPHIYIGLASRFMQGRSALTAGQCAPIDDALEAAGWQRPSQWFKAEGGTSWLKEDCNDGVLLTSRGGDRIDRTFCEAFVRPGPGVENWTSRTNYMTLGVLQTGPAELSLYVLRRYAQVRPYLERMTLRLDGFASVNAPYDGGEMLTKPFRFSGRELVLNAATSAAGGIRVEIQEDHPAHEAADPEPPGNPVPGYTLDDCPEIIGDEIERVVRWKEGPDVSRLAGKPIRLRFVMKDADLYALRFRG
ncbi:MAG: hypothetical protein HYU36_21990 [Planctomycetes bacterium]|nr:hypothetical protein [Planctomycetota bacterium]